MSVPLDSDGFLRRACPTCRREFKWLPQDDSEPAPADGYYCPYCATQSDPHSWWTEDQIRLAGAHAANMAQDELDKVLRGIRRSSGPMRIDYKSGARNPIPNFTEPDDMTMTTSPCHPGEPLKIETSWDRAVHCLMCGQDLQQADS